MDQYDFIIAGSGIAGLTAALHAAEISTETVGHPAQTANKLSALRANSASKEKVRPGKKHGTGKAKVLIVSKSKLAEGSTLYAQGGIAAAVGPKDSFKKHIADTLAAGHGLNNKKAVEFIVKRGPAAVLELKKFGVRFNSRKNGRPDLKLEGGHSEKRIVYFKDEIGKEIETALIKKVRQTKNITVLENTFVKDLILSKTVTKKPTTCIGIKIIRNNKFSHIYGRRVILATGGIGQIYAKTTNPKVSTGDGIGIAARAGCKIDGMEFVQFHPTALNGTKNPLFLLSETLRGEGAFLVNEKGERFMKRIHPLAELAPRDIISRTMIKQRRCYLDLRHIPLSTLKKKYPNILTAILKSGKNPEKDLIPATPAAHYLCGGIKTDLHGRTNIKNLYAAGECANTGLHGSNRLASNSLLEAAVMGKQTATDPLPQFHANHNKTVFTADFSTYTVTSDSPDKIAAKRSKSALPATNLKKPTADKIHALRNKIQTDMWQHAGIIRNKKSLIRTLQHLRTVKKQIGRLPADTTTSTPLPELQNMLETATLIVKAALNREKSVGTHYRTA